MARNHDDQNTVRQYLLKQLSDDEQRTIEQRLLAEDELFEELEIAEDELIDDYLAEKLSQDGRKTFERSFLVAPERKQKLRFAEALKRHMPTPTPEEEVNKESWLSRLERWLRQSFFASPLLVAAVLLIVVGLGFAVWRGFFYQSDVDKGLIALNDAYRQQRPVEARISQLDYAPFSVMRGAEPEQVDSLARDRAERILLDAVHNKPGAESYHALGKLYLTKKEFDKAIAQFEEALKADPNNAQIYADLGAALLEKGKLELEKGKSDKASSEAGKGLEDLGRSLENLNRALEVNPNLLEAFFNRALCYQFMKLPRKAEEDWGNYLTKDSSSPWAEEARKNLKLIQEQLNKTSQTTDKLIESFSLSYYSRDDEAAWIALRSSRTRAGNLIVEALIDEYVHVIDKSSSTDNDEAIRKMVYAGNIEEQKADDRFTIDVANFYNYASPTQTKLAKEARLLKKRAGESYNRSEFEDAIDLYSRSTDLFLKAGDHAEAMLAETGVGYSYLRIPDSQKSIELFERLANQFKSRSYRSMLAQTFMAMSDASTSRDELSKALAFANQSIALAEQVSDDASVVRGLQQFVSVQLNLGSYLESLAFAVRALTLVENIADDPKLKWPFYHEVALNFYFLGRPSCALEFEQEAARLAVTSGMPLLKSRSWERLGLINEKMRRFDQAIKYGHLALEEGKNITGQLSRTNVMAHSNLNLGQLYRESGDWSKALTYYDQALDLYKQLNLNIYLYQVHKGRLLALIGLKEDSAAERELGTVLELFEQNRSRILEESHRNKFFDVGQNTYDVAIDFTYSRSGAEQALRYAEASRARSLNELMTTGARIEDDHGTRDLKLGSQSKSLSPSEIREQLPEQVQLLQYAVLDDKVVIWVIKQSAIESETTVIDASELQRQTESYTSSLRRPTQTNRETLKAEGKQLYAELVSPVEKYLDPKLVVCIIADKSLNYLPFEALISKSSGRYFVEDYKLERASSATVFIRSSEQAKLRPKVANERLLSVGNPRFDRSEYESLPDLPAAAKEVEGIAAFYGPAAPLVGEEATATRVKQALGSAEVIHFATHAVADERSPLQSRFVLAGKSSQRTSKEMSNDLLAAEIYEMKLPRARLVVLSACQTGIERAYRGEGAVGLARPFIAAGVPLVVASLWAVDSETTADLMISFHKHRKQDQLSTVEALRRAQLEMIQNLQSGSKENYGWAAFTTIGGYSAF